MDVIMPEFSSCRSLSAWVNSLADEEIQSWKSKDWVELYRAIQKCLRKPGVLLEAKKYYMEREQKKIAELEKEISELQKKLTNIAAIKAKTEDVELKKDYNQYYNELKKTIKKKEKEKEDSVKRISPMNDKTTETPIEKELKEKLSSKETYLKENYTEMFNKLYENYRLEPEIMNYMIKIGKEIGRVLARSHVVDTSVLALNINKRKEYAEHICSTVFSYFFPYVTPEDALKAQHDISVKEIDVNGKAGISEITISDKINDGFLATISHEAIHAYGETTKQFGDSAFFTMGFYPEGYKNEDGKESQAVKDFFTVLRYNQNRFYLPKELTKSTKRARKHQPTEKHVYIISKIIELTYRQETQQYSERNSLDLYEYTRPILGVPTEVKYNGKAITHKYKITDKLNLQKVQDVFAEMDPQLRKELNIRTEKESFILYDVPETYDARNKVMVFIKKMKSEAGKKAKAHIIAQQIAYRKQQKTK